MEKLESLPYQICYKALLTRTLQLHFYNEQKLAGHLFLYEKRFCLGFFSTLHDSSSWQSKA